MSNDKSIYLINNGECDIIEYDNCEDISDLEVSGRLNNIIRRINNILGGDSQEKKCIRLII